MQTGRVTQDRRLLSRVGTRLECEVVSNGVQSKALILDLSLKGAHLACQQLPATGAAVVIRLSSPQLEKPLVIQSKVVPRRARQVGKVPLPLGNWQRFGVSFERMVCELVPLLKKPAERPIYVHPGRAR
jgi:hypothetical protein